MGTLSSTFAQKCTEAHVEPVLDIAIEANERRMEARNREYERKKGKIAVDYAAEGSTDRPSFS
jgi:hypothetical protein